METPSSLGASSDQCMDNAASSSSHLICAPRRSGGTASRTPTSVQSNDKNDFIANDRDVHAWRLMSSDQKRKIYRVRGAFLECPQYNISRAEDCRLTTTAPTVYNRKKSAKISLPVPQFQIDDHYCVIPPYRELSITGLNDNVDEKFLRGLCKKGEEPLEVVVFYDPKTRKHLGMAFIDFDAKWKSDVFISKHNGRTMMGSVVTCFFDPMAYKISKIYEEITNTPVQLPKRYWNMKSSKAISAMRQMLADVYALEKEAQKAAEREKVSPGGFRNFSFYNKDVEVSGLTRTPFSHDQENTHDPAFANTFFNDVARASRREVVDESGSHETVNESGGNYGCASTSTTPSNGHNYHNHVERRSDVDSRTTPVRCRTPPTPAYTPMSDSKNTSVERPSRTPPCESQSFSAQPMADSESVSILLRTTSAYINQNNNNNNNKERLNGFTPMPATLPPISHMSFIGESHHESSTAAVNGCDAKAGAIRKGSLKRMRRTHRWSSSSESGSSDEDSRSRMKRSYHRSGDVLSTTCRFQNTLHTPTTPLFSSTPSAVYTNGRLSDVASNTNPKPPLPPSLLSPLMRLPPPGVVESPTLASGSSSSQPAENSPKKQRNLEQRLVHIFGKGPNSHSTGTPSVNTPSSSSSSCAPPSVVAAAAAATSFCYHQQPSFVDHSARSPSRSQHNQQLLATNGRSNFTAYVAPAERWKLSQTEIEAELERRATADLTRERQDKLFRCFDISRKVHSMYFMEAHLSIKKDLYRRLDAEAYKILDAEFEARKKRQSGPSSHEQTNAKDAVVQRAGETRLMSMFPRFDDSNAESIFGMPYNVRMSAMPSFKKKKPAEVRRHVDEPASNKSKKLSNKMKETERTTSKKEKKFKKHIRDRNQSVESDTSLFTHRKRSRKESASSKTREKKHYRRSRSPSTASSFINDLLNSTAAEHDGSTVPTTNASSEAEDDSPTMDEREKRLRDAEIGCQEEKDDSGVKKSLIEKRALLNSLLRDSTSSEETSPPVEDMMVDLIAADFTKLVDSTAKVVGDEEQAAINSQWEADNSGDEKVGEEIAFVTVEPPSIKRLRFERQLESLLHVTAGARSPPPAESRIWPKRSEEDDLAIVNQLQESHLNEEDCAYIKVAFMRLWDYFDEMMPSDRKLIWVQPTIPPVSKELPSKVSKDNCEFYYDDADLYNVVPHKTGCARTEGYYKVNRQRKRLLRRFDNETSRTDISTQDETAIRHKVQASKDERAMNRRLKTWIGDSNLVRVNQLKYRGKMIKFARSRIHGWGLYALETIMPEEMIIEYVGEKIRPTVADEREKNYERRGMGSSYMFRIDGDAVIDATKKGNYGRFINHSCMPNCTARVVMVDGEKRIVIYSKRLIERGEEITYDYKFAREDEASKIECLCGARTCHKYLN